MSNFAERLVARSAGAPPAPGISVLAPRPVSRFEPTVAIDIEAIVDAEHPVAAAAITARPLEDTSRTQHYEADTASPVARMEAAQTLPLDVGETRQRHAATHPVASEIAAERDRATTAHASADVIPTAHPQPTARTRVNGETLHLSPQPAAEQVLPPANSGRAREIQIVHTEQRAAAPLAQAAAVREEKAEQPSAPVISIGKIEVQFLPQEARMPAPRPEPQRTRGFAAYARARRGEPR
jgi:hypothetical protein